MNQLNLVLQGVQKNHRFFEINIANVIEIKIGPLGLGSAISLLYFISCP